MADNHDISIQDSLKVIASPAAKPCGGCTACCTILRVDSLSKPTHTPCPNICQRGCAIYANKPLECDTWECAWKSGWIEGDERRRPDNLGIMFEYRLVGGRSFLWAYEVWPNALDDPKVAYLLNRLGKKENLVTCKCGSMRVYAEAGVIEFLKRHGVGTQDVPIVPLQMLRDANGAVVGRLITERVGNEFVLTKELDAPAQLLAEAAAQDGDEESVLADAVEKTKAILNDHRDALDRIAAVLFKRGKVTGDEIREIVGDVNEVGGGTTL